MKGIFMEQSFLFTVFWKNEMYIGDISEMMDNPGVKKRLFSAIQNGNIDDWVKCTKPSDAS